MESAGQIVVSDDPGQPGCARLVLSGRVTAAHAAQFHAAAMNLATSGRPVRVCCAAVEYLDAAALQVFLCLGRELLSRGARCDVTDVPPALAEVFRLTGVGAAA